MCKITFNVNNGGKMTLEQHDHDEAVEFSIETPTDYGTDFDASFNIPPGDFVMLMNSYEYWGRTGEWKPGDFIKADCFRVRKVGENDGYYRIYYYDDQRDKYYAVEDLHGMRTWYTTSCNDGEPDYPLKDGLIFEIMDGERIIRRERISRVDDCNSIGITVAAVVTCLHCGREFFGGVSIDDLGAHSYCDASFDFDL